MEVVSDSECDLPRVQHAGRVAGPAKHHADQNGGETFQAHVGRVAGVAGCDESVKVFVMRALPVLV